ncbi:ricin-type beta-trefoil lectin domain protein [Streptomyces sp. NPDC056660]|uniref:ricin-type beta-trefoil lectin domain protein n=1 Tax=Streptomyces sp. NPDC056660 TaxID=3345897 RepID=UPI0036866B60
MNAATGRCLDVRDGDFDNGTDVVTAACSASATQRWRVDADRGVLQSAADPDFCLDSRGPPSIRDPPCRPGSARRPNPPSAPDPPATRDPPATPGPPASPDPPASRDPATTPGPPPARNHPPAGIRPAAAATPIGRQQRRPRPNADAPPGRHPGPAAESNGAVWRVSQRRVARVSAP